MKTENNDCKRHDLNAENVKNGSTRGGATVEEKSDAGGCFRPAWNDYFLKMAFWVAERSTCLRRRVGCVLVKDKKVIATGYNGAPAGLAHCIEVGCMRERLGIPSGQRHELCRGVHAEQNAIIQAATSGENVRGCSVYCTTFPCFQCVKMLINCGVREIYYVEQYPDENAMKMLAGTNVKCVRCSWA